MTRMVRSTPAAALGLIGLLVVACGGGTPAATPTPAPATEPVATAAASAGPTEGATTAPTNASTGEPSVKADAQVPVGASFEVQWTGPNANGDYVTIVKAGATEWTNEPYFYTASTPSPGKLTAPGTPGSYELWYVSGGDEKILAKTSLTVSAFVGSISAPDTVAAGTVFDVSWTGPDGPGDYVTIVKPGATWTNEPYFYTNLGPTNTLLAPIDAGAYELLYVSGSGSVVQLRRPIAVTPYSASVDGPGTVAKGASVTIAWTGPNGPGDYITIAPAGSSDGTYLNYCYTAAGPSCVIDAPDTAGAYEVRYVTGGAKVLASEALQVK